MLTPRIRLVAVELAKTFKISNNFFKNRLVGKDAAKKAIDFIQPKFTIH
jgi:hypothetical protein